MNEEQPVDGYANLYYDPTTSCYVLYTCKERTCIQICGERCDVIARNLHDHLHPPTPGEVKTIY